MGRALKVLNVLMNIWIFVGMSTLSIVKSNGNATVARRAETLLTKKIIRVKAQ